ncbi:MAG: cadmium-translocating P-type ATPase [Clostridiales bacterium]|nr:cadmium-translocating P-type ATPase [Clostridiales bacterium]
MSQNIFVLKGLNCPHCAAKIERDVAALAGVESASINLIKQTLTVSGEVRALTKKVTAIVKKYEDGVEVLEQNGVVAPQTSFDKVMLIRIIIGLVLFAIGLILGAATARAWIRLAVFACAYLAVGFDVLFKAIKNIVRGRATDEHFLMSLSTVGAIIIGEYPEAVAVMLFYQIGELFQSAAVARSRKSITCLMELRPDHATVVRDQQLTVSPDEVEVGEIIVIKPGDRVPLDGVVKSGSSRLDTSALTGESVLRSVSEGDEVLSGCVNSGGVLTVEVTRRAKESTASKIIDLVENASSKKAPAENFITAFARYYTPAVVVLAVLLAVAPSLVVGGWSEWVHRALVFLVVSCPCALVVSVPLTYFGGIGAASRQGVLVKGGNYLDVLAKVDTVIFDKTGTLTKGQIEVSQVLPMGISQSELLRLAATAECYSTHPIARSIVDSCGLVIDKSDVSFSEEISGKGLRVISHGDEILAGNDALMREYGVELKPCDKQGTKVYVTKNRTYVGCILLSDTVKADSKSAIDSLKRQGIAKTVMLTGDERSIAKEVTGQLGIDELYAELLPHQKVEMLEQIASEGKVAFVGDGINDAPVLARADVGVAMGGLGSDAAIEAADVVLMSDEPSALPRVIDIAKRTNRIVRQNIIFALGVKAAILILGAFGIAGMWAAVFGDVGVTVLAVGNALRIMKRKK